MLIHTRRQIILNHGNPTTRIFHISWISDRIAISARLGPENQLSFRPNVLVWRRSFQLASSWIT